MKNKIWSKFTKIDFSGVNPVVWYAILSVIGLTLGFCVHFFFNRPNFSTFLASSMDSSGNAYVLGVKENNNQFLVTKVNTGGSVSFQINLEKAKNKLSYTYSNLTTDSLSNFYVVKRAKDTTAVATDETQLPIISETVLMYNSDGKFVKEIVKMNFQDDPNPPKKPYFKKIQAANQTLSMIANRMNTYDVIVAHPLLDESPQKTRTFEIQPSIQTSFETEWVSDIAVLSNGRAVYSTFKGELFAMDNQGQFLDYTNVIMRDEIFLTNLSVDSSDNLYFTDALTGTFYKFNTRSTSAESLFRLESPATPDGKVRIKDLRPISVIDKDDYYASSKDFKNPYHVRFGSNNKVIKNITGAFFPWGIVLILLGVASVFLLYFGVKALRKIEIKRIPLAIKILGGFAPVYVIAMAFLLYLTANDSVKDYKEVLMNTQDTGSKIVAGGISGDEFTSINHVTDYMTSGYIQLLNSMNQGYKDLTYKINDKSDYLVAYFIKDNQIYSTFNNKHSINSGSYSVLKYTDPDMIGSGTNLVDYYLENNELTTIKGVWNALKDDPVSTQRAKFSDVRGDLTASFSAIRDQNGNAVGFIGNFLDEDIHFNSEFSKILWHSVLINSIFTLAIFAFLVFVVRRVLSPLKKVEKAINLVSDGRWETRIDMPSNDEFADIVEAFNQMAEKLGRYTKNLITLNKEYLRYVPGEVFKLIGKDKITKINLYDYRIIKIGVLYVTFNISWKEAYNFKTDEELFKAINESYESIFKIAHKNSGVIQTFNGTSVTILFPNKVQDAYNASSQFKEIFINEKIKDNMRITLDHGEVLIGVSGNDKRRGVIVVSDEIMQLFHIDSKLKQIGINHAVTERIIKNLEKTGICNYRFIGNAQNISGSGSTKLYEIIDMTNKYKKDLYLNTKDLFENAVLAYTQKNTAAAQKMFLEVLNTNNKDKVAVHYLLKCEEAEKSGFKGWTEFII